MIVKNVVATASAMSAEQNSQKARTSNAQVVRVLGKKGRITIPYEIRQRIGFRYNDVLSFTQQDDGSVVVRKEKICDNCNEFAEEYEENYTLEDFLDSLSEEEQRNALLHLSLLWAEKQKH